MRFGKTSRHQIETVCNAVGVPGCNVLEASHLKSIEIIGIETADGYLVPDARRDIAAVAVIERYHNSGRVGKGFVKGFGLKRGEVSSSTNHSNHHVCAIGTNYDDMQLALSELKLMGGGYSTARSSENLGCPSWE